MIAHSAPVHYSVVRLCLCLLILVPAFLATGCDQMRNQLKADREGNRESQDYRDALASRLPEPVDTAQADAGGGIPDLQPYVASPDGTARAMPLVSISVNQSVPLRDVLYELAQQADYDLELDPKITGSIIFTARERPFDEVIQRIADTAGLRYKFDQGVLRVQLDTPYNHVYKIDYLSYIRSNKGSVKNNISVVTGEGADTGSQFEVTTESEADFWAELDGTIKQLLGSQYSGLRTSKTPRVMAADQNPNVQAVAPASPDGKINVMPPQAVLNVQTLPEDDVTIGVEAAAVGGAATYAINKQAGLINIYANEKSHKEVERYLKLLRKSVTAQVLIEAKILEVTLNEQFATGIDWRLMDSAGDLTLNYLTGGGAAILDSLGPGTEASVPGIDGVPIGRSGIVIGSSGDDIQGMVKAISQFGSVKGLASPRLTVLNNQSAVLNVASNQVYFDVDIDVTTDEGVTEVDISSDAHTVPEGVLVNVQPSIDLDNNTISLAVRPTVTRIVNFEEDPAVAFITAQSGVEGVSSGIPEVNVQEIDSVIQVRSGQPIVMGGLLQDRTDALDEGVPILSETPLIGSLFKQHADRVSKTELVIFLKATILEAPGESVHSTDKDLYREFSGDRRPFSL